MHLKTLVYFKRSNWNSSKWRKRTKEKGFLTLLGTLGASLLGNLLTGKIINRVGKGKGINRASERIIRADYGHPSSSALHNNKMDF